MLSTALLISSRIYARTTGVYTISIGYST